MMKLAPMFAIAIVTMAVACAADAADQKQLQNMKGNVSYQLAQGAATKPLAPNATIALIDNSYAITGDDSLAAVELPDSSQVEVGSASKVQLAFFNAAVDNSAKFILYNGRVRFAVRHPQGAKANYTFTTTTGSVAVRGTQGDIGFDVDGSMRVNVYEVCDKNLPVEVTLKNGQTFTLNAGQSLVAQLVNGVLKAEVQQLTQQLVNQFAPDFGVPASWDEATGAVVSYAQNKTTDAVNSVTNGVGGNLVGGLFNRHASSSTPAPAPAATAATCQ